MGKTQLNEKLRVKKDDSKISYCLNSNIRIVDNTITEEEAIEEYMKLGDSRELARKIYLDIRGML
mgnify:CR=1 FL=1|jgi:hypothetical protein